MADLIGDAPDDVALGPDLPGCTQRVVWSGALQTRHSLKPVRVYTDNKGAYDLCHRFTSASNSRHIDRKIYKMRELRGAGTVLVDKVLTEDKEVFLLGYVTEEQADIAVDIARHISGVKQVIKGFNYVEAKPQPEANQ